MVSGLSGDHGLFVNEATDDLYVATAGNVVVFANASTLSGAVTITSASRTINLNTSMTSVYEDLGRNTLYIGNAPALPGVSTIYGVRNADSLTGTATAATSITGVGGMGQLGNVVGAGNTLAGCDFSSTIYLWTPADTISGNPPSPPVTKTLTTTGTQVSGVFYVP